MAYKLVPFPGWEDIAATKFRPLRKQKRNRFFDAQRQKDYRRSRSMLNPSWADKERQRLEAWRNANPDKVQDSRRRRKRWKRKHDPVYQEKKRLHCARRRSRKRSLPSDLSTNDWGTILEVFGYSCAYCDKRQGELDKTLHKEHVIPISEDGGFTIDNIIPACFDCNVSKSNKDMRTWLQDEQRYEAIMTMIGDAEYLCQQ